MTTSNIEVRRLGQQGASSRILPGWHTLGFGHGRNETTAYVKNDVDARLYASATDLLAALREARATLDSIAGWNIAARPGHADHASRLDIVARATRAEAAASAAIAKAEGGAR